MFNTVPDKSNPIFSSYSVMNADFNENMDEYVKAPHDIWIEEQKKKVKAEIPKNINEQAINNIPVMPDFLKEEYVYVNKKPEWLVELEKNVATPEDIEAWKKQGSMSIGEVAKQGKKWGYMIPFAGSSAETIMVVRNANTLRRLKNGEEVSSVDAELLYDFLREEKEKEIRGVTFGGKALDGLRTGLGYLAEFGLGLAAIPEAGVGFAAIGKTLSEIGAKKAARKAVQNALKEAAIKSAAPSAIKHTVPLSTAKKIYKDTLVKTTGAKALANVGVKEGLKTTVKGLPRAVATSAAFGNTVMLPHTINDIASRQLATGVYITDLGEAVLTDSENLALSFMKAIGNSTFETLTETVGWMFSPVANYFAKPIQKVLPKKFFTEFEKLVSSRYGMPAANAFKKYGYDGVIEEMGEEVLNRFLCQVFGINGLDEYNFDGFMNNVLYANDPSQWGVEALTFAATSALLHGGMGAQSKVAETWKKNQYKKDVAKLTAKANKYIQSPAQFYLDQGLIKINGSQSLAEQKLREVWSEQNIDKDLQDSILKNMSETEIRSELKKAIEDKTKNATPEEAAQRIEKDLTKKFLDNKTFANEKDAKTVAALFAAPLQKLSETTGISLEKLMQEEIPEIQREAEEAAKANGRYIQTDGRIEEIFNELNNLPNDFADEEYCQQLLDEADILSKIRDGNLEEADFSKAKSLIRTLDYAGYTEFADELRELSYNQTGQLFQSENLEKNLIDNFGMSEKDITDNIKADVENLLSEYDIAPEEFTLEDIRLYGSYSKGVNKNGSDLDFVVLYSGNMSEDSAFNILNETKLTITDKDGNEIEVDINPINKAERGSIDDYLSDIEKLEPKKLFQVVDTAGAEGSAEISAAKKEWQEKGVESSYFKKWFGDSKVVDENGKPKLLTDDKEIYITDGYSNNGISRYTYKGSHRAPSYSSGNVQERLENSEDVNLEEVAQGFHNQPDDYFSPMGARYYMYDDKEGMESATVVRNITRVLKSGNKNTTVKVYRAVSADVGNTKLKNGDWITLSKSYAEIHGETNLDGDYKIIEQEVPVTHVWWDGNDIREWGYDNGQEQSPDLFLSIQNPKYQDELPADWKEARAIRDEGYDGIITTDGKYLVFEKMQIKSVDNQGTFDETNPNIYYQGGSNYQERLEDVKNNLEYKKFVNKVLSGKLTPQEKSKPLYIGKTPAKLIEAGLPENNISIGYKIIEKAQNNKNADHNLSKETISEVWNALKNPIAVIKAEQNENEKKENNRYSAILDLQDDNGKYVLVAIEINKKTGNSVVNDIRSIHARKSYEPIIDKALNDKRLLKVDAEKIRNLLWGSSDIISEGDQASSKKDLLTSQQSDLISDGAASLIERIAQQKNDVKFYQGATENDKNLLMTHAMKSCRLDDVIESGGLIAPSFAITKKDMEGDALNKFGDILFIRNPKKIDFQNDNIYDRDIYSPRIPQPWHDIPNGRVVDDYEYESLKRNYESNPEKFVEKWGKTFDEMFKGAKKVLNLGFTPSGSSKFVPYTNENILKEMKKEGLVNKEGFDYGLSSLLSRFSTQKKDLKSLKKTAKGELGSTENLDEKYEQINKEYEELGEKLAPLYWDKWSFYEFQSDVFYAIAKNKKKYLKDTYNIEVPAELEKEVKEFVEKAKSLPRSYFEAKPMREVDLSEFSYAIAEKGVISDKQKQALEDKGIKVVEYNHGEKESVIKELQTKVPEVYFQKREEEPIQTNMLYDNITPRKLRNMNIKGAFVPAENLIELFKNADESTIIHEFAHWWLSRLEKYAEQNEELALDLAEVRKFLKNDGGAFTREQHEKFAVGFEAYIRNGSARSNRLKRIFEDFKNALIQIYDSIKQLVYTEDGSQYSFTEADVQNLERLFERLLTTENERIKKTVFDRCDDINDRIKEIKARQEEEMKELDELWKGNIAANNRTSDKKRKVEEYLELAETAVNRVPKEVKEMKQRYKDATLGILSVATGMSKNAIANSRNWEKVQLSLEHADDKITVSGGMRAEWEEFYSDTGVNYDTDEVGGDFELAQKAFDVLTEGSYNFGNMNEDEIGKFYGKFDYLYNKVQNLKGEEKTTALEALYTLFNDMPSMPDEVTADLVEKLSKIETEYDESQKEDFNRKSYPTIPVVQQLQYYVTNKLSDLKVYDPNVRYKVRISKSHSLYKAIKGATSVNSTKRIIRKINEYVIADLENQAKNILHKEIQKQIRLNSKLVKVGTISKGKFDWKTNTVFAELAQINKLKPKEALMEYGAIIELDKVSAGEERERNNDNIVSTPEIKTDFQSNLKRKFLEYRSNKVKDLNLTATRSLLEDIMTLKFEGRRAKDEYELEKQLQKDNMKTDLVERVRELKGKKAAIGIAKFIMGETLVTSEKTLINWETANNALFGKEVAQRYSLLKLESDAEVYAYKRYSDFCKKAIDIYDLNNPVGFRQKAWHKFNEFVDFANNQPLVDLMRKYEEEVYNYKEVTYSKETGQFIETGVQLSRAEIITLYAWSMNEELEQRIFTQYGLHQVQHMFEQVLSEEDKQFAWLLIDTCEAMYEDNNEVFIRTMGLSLPKVENYFPSKTVRIGSEIDMLHENVVRSSNPSFIKQRKSCKRIKMKPESPLSILLPHINKTARYVILSERLNYLNAIFKDGTVRAAIKEVFDGIETPDKIQAGTKVKGKKNKKQRTVGDRIHDSLINQLGCSTFENYARGINVGKSFMDYVATNYITSRIGGNLKVAFGQLTSMINYCENMPSGLWAVGFAKCLKHPKETIRYMLENCDYLNARLAGNSMNEVMLKITDEADRFRSLRNFCVTNTKYGDLVAIAIGGKPYVDYLISQGMTKEAAFEKFVEDTMRSQQAGQASSTSIWQKKQSENPLSRMVFAFNNTTLQYERKFVDAMMSRARGDISTKEFMKALLIYKVFNPILFTTFLSNLSFMNLVRGLMGDDDDGVKNFGIDVGSSILFANLAAYGYLGMTLSTIGSFAMTLIDKKEYKPFLKTIPIIGDLEDMGKNLLLKNEVSVADWVDAMALVVDDTTGVPATRLVNTAGGVGDVAKGNIFTGLLRMIGYGKYRANVAATGQPPEKKKKKK